MDEDFSEGWQVRAGARAMARSIEVGLRRAEVASIKRPGHADLVPADERIDPDSGRRSLAPDPVLVAVGRYLRRSRRYSERSQRQLASATGVSQSTVSRLERGLAPATALERFVRVCHTLSGLFPLGFCPHDHDCAWQPIRPPERQTSDTQRFLEYLLKEADG